MDQRRKFIADAASARKHAETLLHELLAASSECESHLAEQSRPDPMRLVTGKSSLERAIHDTRRMLELLDRAIADADRTAPGLLESISASIAMLRAAPARSQLA
ncbi:MAG: hypothetical protein AB7G11_09830 [Phycisphaerales bacterium]